MGIEVVLLSLGHGSDDGCAGTADPTGGVRVPVLTCRDELRAGGATVRIVEANSDSEIDRVVTDTLVDSDGRLVVVGDGDGEPRAVVRRMMRRYAPPPSTRPDDLPEGRTVYDLPPIGVLSLDPAGTNDLVARLGLPRGPEEVAAAVLGDRSARFDLLRTDSGSVTLHGALVGGADTAGRPVAWQGTVNVDDQVLTDGSDPLLACSVVNADGAGYADVDGLPMVTRAEAADGVLDVAVAVFGYAGRRWLGNRRPRIEVRRARGRAVAVEPRGEVPFTDDGTVGTLTRKRTWWMERAAWAAYR